MASEILAPGMFRSRLSKLVELGKIKGPMQLRHCFNCHVLLLSVAALLCAGCAHVGPQHQRLLSKSNMTFSDSAVFSYQDKLLPQVEPGSAFSGGAQASGCTSCK